MYGIHDGTRFARQGPTLLAEPTELRAHRVAKFLNDGLREHTTATEDLYKVLEVPAALATEPTTSWVDNWLSRHLKWVAEEKEKGPKPKRKNRTS